MMVERKVKTILAELTLVPVDELMDKTSLIFDLYMDSLLFTEMIYELENEFSIKITDEEVVGLYTIHNVIEFVNAKL